MSVADATTDGKESAVFPLSHGVRQVDDRRVIRGIVDVIRDGFRWNDAPNAEGPYKTLSNCIGRWRRLGMCKRIVAVLPNQGPKPLRLMIAASHVTAHRPGARVRQQGGSAGSDGRWIAYQARCWLRWHWPSAPHRPDRRAAQ